MASQVWDYFNIESNDANYAVCTKCSTKISRGGKSHTTSNLIKHLAIKHGISVSNAAKKQKFDVLSTAQNAMFPGVSSEELVDSPLEAKINVPTPSSSSFISINQSSVQKGPTPNKLVQPTLFGFIDSKRQFKPGDHRSTAITEKIGRMICLDNRPFSIVEAKGFQELMNFVEPRYKMPSRNHFSGKVIPDLYSETRERVSKMLHEAEHVSLTTDMWSSSMNDDYLGVTAHFIDEDFTLNHVCLEVIPFPEVSHSATNIKDFLMKTLEEWDLSEKISAIVTDNGRNMVLATNMSPYLHIPCLAHSLQLVVKDGILNNKNVTNLIGTCRRIVGHFKHSSNAYKILRKKQEIVKCPLHRLIQDEPTRWNSSLHMMARLLEQKPAILLASTELKIPADLTSIQWGLMENVVDILSVFDKATFAVSSTKVSISETIPIINSIRQELEKPPPMGSGLQSTLNDLQASISMRYKNVEATEVCTISTLLDARFKGCVFRNHSSFEDAKTKLIEAVDELGVQNASLTDAKVADGSLKRDVQKSKNPMWQLYSKIIDNDSSSTCQNSTVSASSEVNSYLQEPLLSPDTDVLIYWKMNQKHPRLKKLAKKFLGIPPATVFSERLFSTAGIICDSKRSRLDPERVKMLVFLNKNL